MSNGPDTGGGSLPDGICRLCGRIARLQTSHVLPAFVFRWLKETSATGHLRNASAPNRRVQDGLKGALLCLSCEQRFGSFEATFANNLFYPSVSGRTLPNEYGAWMLKFCVSVSWRVLDYLILTGHCDSFGTVDRGALAAASFGWREFLCDRSPHPGPHEQHFLPLDTIVSHSVPHLDPGINSYFLRCADMDIVSNRTTLMTFVKVGPFAIFGHIRPPQRKWSGTKIRVRHGRVGTSDYLLPFAVMDYFCQRSHYVGVQRESISSRQKAIIWSAGESHRATSVIPQVPDRAR